MLLKHKLKIVPIMINTNLERILNISQIKRKK